MPTPPITIPIPAPVAPLATPEVNLPCGIKAPSIPLIPNLSFSVTIPPFNLFPVPKRKAGQKPSRKLDKLVARAQAIAKMCNGALPVPRP
jgi:hypothetical protein